MLDMLGRRIRSVNEAEKLLGIPAAGWQIRQASSSWWKTSVGTRIFSRVCVGTAPGIRLAVTDELSTIPASVASTSRIAAAATEMVPMLVPTGQSGCGISSLSRRKIAALSAAWASPARTSPRPRSMPSDGRPTMATLNG